ncbi:NUDIX domain-containing protein [Acinetobacter larvae]|uniref:ADP-ribose pyrophosphatase n=1 Tax=Acinetobacter larvae TaxID=1789224 RepID=A0A1B2M3F8_9GAMM|nr:NUDIX domain-containing protein [Acinetobacter larvae]AOA59553.1 NUDIX hydrolase [Acinetobacter larvae]
MQNKLHAEFNQNDVQIESRQQRYRGFIQIENIQLRHRLFGQTQYSPTLSRELICRRPAAGALLYDPEQQKFALIEQFRVGALDDPSPWQLEVIAGLLDGDESPESCIRRECLEEAGCAVEHLQHLFTFYPSAGACNELYHLYAAPLRLPPHGGIYGLSEEGENIKLHLIDFCDLDELLSSPRLRNAPVIMALQWLKQHIVAKQR